MDFVTLLQGLVLVGGVVVIPIVAFAAITATRMAWLRGGSAAGGATEGRVAELETRVAELEQRQAQVAGLEERLDFAERMLAQPRDSAQMEKP